MAENKAENKGKSEGEAEVQKAVDEEQEQGFVGTKVDPTPNENYTLQGVVAGKPTPETDEKAAEDARVSVAENRAKK
jgi:hypothetical protein